MALIAGKCGNLCLQQNLGAPTHDFMDQNASCGALHELAQPGKHHLRKGIFSVFGLVVVFQTWPQIGTPIATEIS